MPELKRPLESSDSTSLVLAKKPRNELVQVTERSKALVESVSYGSRCQSVYVFSKNFNFKNLMNIDQRK